MEVQRLLQEDDVLPVAGGFMPAPTSVRNFANLSAAVFRMLAYPAASSEIRAMVHQAILTDVLRGLQADPNVAFLFVKILNWFVKLSPLAELNLLRVNIFQEGNSAMQANLDVVLGLFAHDVSAVDRDELVALAQHLLTSYAPDAKFNLAPVVRAFLNLPLSPSLTASPLARFVATQVHARFSELVADQLAGEVLAALANVGDPKDLAGPCVMLFSVPPTKAAELSAALSRHAASTADGMQLLKEMLPAATARVSAPVRAELNKLLENAPAAAAAAAAMVTMKTMVNVPTFIRAEPPAILKALGELQAECAKGKVAFVNKLRQCVSCLHPQFYMMMERHDFLKEPHFNFAADAEPDMAMLAKDVAGFTAFLKLFFDSMVTKVLLLAQVKAFLSEYPSMKDYLGPNGNTLLYTACRFNYYDVAVFLIKEMSCHPDFQSAIHGGTALHGACYGGHLNCVRLLMEAGATPSISNMNGEMPRNNAMDGSAKGTDKAEILKLIEISSITARWERLDGATWRPFAEEVQHVLTMKYNTTHPFLLPSTTGFLAEVDPVKFVVRSSAGEQALRWRTCELPHGSTVEFQYLLDSAPEHGWIKMPPACTKQLTNVMEQKRNRATVSGAMPGEAMLVDLSAFTVEGLSSNMTGQFRWVPVPRVNAADSAALLGLVDAEEENLTKPVPPPRPRTPPPVPVALRMACGQPFSDDLPNLMRFFKSPVVLQPSPTPGLVLVLTNSRDQPTVQAEVDEIVSHCRFAAHQADRVVEFKRPPPPPVAESTQRFPLNPSAALQAFLLADNNQIEETVLALDSYEKFRFRLVITPTGDMFLEVRGNGAQVGLVNNLAVRLNYLVGEARTLTGTGQDRIDGVAKNMLRNLKANVPGKLEPDAYKLRKLCKHFVEKFTEGQAAAVETIKVAYAETIAINLTRLAFPNAVANMDSSNLSQLTVNIKSAAKAALVAAHTDLEKRELEREALQSTMQHLTKDLKCEKPSYRTILEGHFERFLAAVPRRACPELFPKLVDIINAAAIQTDACGLNLPLYERSEELLKLIRDNDVISIHTGTGTGKSTLLPPLLVSEEFKRVAVTQPRRLPCRSVGQRVLNTFQTPLCGWVMAGESYEAKRPIIYVTDGLLREWLQACLPTDPSKPVQPMDYDIIFLDEVHERGWNTDICIGLLATLMGKWKAMGKPVKLILASATLDADVLQPFTTDAHVKVGRFSLPMKAPFPVTVTLKPRDNPVQLAIDLFRTKERLDQILIFMPSVADVREAVTHFSELTRTTAHPLYANQDPAEQKKSIDSGSVFFSTTIAETSLTFPHLRYVVDTGEINESKFDTELGLPMLGPVAAPKSTLLQRQGRLGRTKPGEYFGLYEESVKRLQFPAPQIVNADILDIDFSLRLRGSSLRQLMAHLPTKPSAEALKYAETRLASLGLIDSKGNLLPEIKEFPILGGARITAATYAGMRQYNCGYDMILLAAMLRAQPSDSSLFLKSVPQGPLRSADGDIMTLIQVLQRLRQEKNHHGAAFSVDNFATSAGFNDKHSPRILRFASEHFDKFEFRFNQIPSLRMLAQKSARTWEPVCRALLAGYGSFVFCSQQLLHGNKGLYSAYGNQRPSIGPAGPAAAAAAGGGGGGKALAPGESLPSDITALLSFDSILARKPKEDAVPWIIVLQAFYTPRQQEHLTLAMAGVFDPKLAEYPITRRVTFVSDEKTMFTEGASRHKALAALAGSELVLKGTLGSVATSEMDIYSTVVYEDSVEVKEDPTFPPLKQNIKDLQDNIALFNPFIWKWRNEHQVDIKVNTATPGTIIFKLKGRKRDVLDAAKSLRSFAYFLRDTAVVTIHDTGRVPTRVPLDDATLTRLRRVTDPARTALDLWQWSKGKDATRATRMEVVAWVAVCEYDCRVEGGFVRDWVVRGHAEHPPTPPSSWIEWDSGRKRFEVVKGVTPTDLDMELPFKFVSMEKFINRLHKLGFQTEVQKFPQGYNFVVDRNAPTGPFTLDLIYPHNVATHDRVDFDVNNLYCVKGFCNEFGMRVDISDHVTTEQIVQHTKNKELLVMKSRDGVGIMDERIKKMQTRGWKLLGEIVVTPNRGPKFGATFLPVSKLDPIFQRLQALFKDKLPAATITAVHSVSAYNLDMLYKAMQSQIELENGGNANEALLLHGTDPKNIQGIMDSGFDNRYWSSSGNHGHGAYFADDPAKSNQYAKVTGERAMFWCKVLLGRPETVNTTNTSRKCPIKDCHSVIYDSPGSFKEYMVYRYGQVKPYVLIRYSCP